MTLPQGRAGSLLAVLMLLALISAIGFGAVLPLVDWHAGHAADLETQHALLRRMRALSQSLPTLEQAAASQGSGLAPTLLQGNGDAVAAANLQAAVQEMATAAEVRITSIETLAADPRGAYRAIRLRLAATAPWPALLDLLSALDGAEPRMLLDELALRAVPTLQRTGEVPIDANFVVTAFRAADPGGVRP